MRTKSTEQLVHITHTSRIQTEREAAAKELRARRLAFLGDNIAADLLRAR